MEKKIIFNFMGKAEEIIELKEKELNRSLTIEEIIELKDKLEEENKELVNIKFNNKYELIEYIEKMLLEEQKIKPLNKIKVREIQFELRRRSRLNNIDIKESTDLYYELLDKLNIEHY